jgi:hypothetical protein
MSKAIKGLYDKGSIPKANWTIIIYLNGESDLLDDVKKNYNQVAKFGSELGKVNFVVLFDGLKIPREDKPEPLYRNLHPRIYLVSRFEDFMEDNHLQEFPKQEDLSKPGSLSVILKRIKAKFPADKFGFIYNGHAQAGGPAVNNNKMMVKLARKHENEKGEHFIARLKNKYEKEGWELAGTGKHVDNPALILAVFEKEGNGQFLSYQQMGIELKRSGFNRKDENLGFVCLDCCWGQTIETAECFKDATRYLIASADEASLFGIGYDDFAEFMLKKHETIKYDELANNLVGIYFKHNYDDYLGSDDFGSMGVSMSCLDLGIFYAKDKFGRPLAKDEFGRPLEDAITWKMKVLFVYLYENLPGLWKIIHWARKKCVDYTYSDPDDYCTYNIDFMWFLENLLHYNSLFKGRRKDFYDPELHIHASRLAMELSMRFIKSNLASNYKELEINSTKAQLGGKGLAITFPVNKEQFDKSIYAEDGVFSGNPYWRKFLKRYATLGEETEILWEGRSFRKAGRRQSIKGYKWGFKRIYKRKKRK